MADYNGSRWLEKVMKFGERYGEKQRLQLIEHKPLTKRQARTMLDNLKKNYPQHAETIERLGMATQVDYPSEGILPMEKSRRKKSKLHNMGLYPQRYGISAERFLQIMKKDEQYGPLTHDECDDLLRRFKRHHSAVADFALATKGMLKRMERKRARHILSDPHTDLGKMVFEYTAAVDGGEEQQTTTPPPPPFNFKTAIHASPSQFLSSAINLLNFKREGYEDDSNIVSFPFGLSNFFTSSDVVKMMRSPIEYCHSLFSKQDDAMLTYLKKWRYRYRPNEAELADFRERIMDGIVYRAILLCLLSLDRDKWGATYAGGYFSQLKVRMLRAEAAERTLRRVNDELAEVCKQHHVSAVDFATATAPTPSVLRRVKRKRIGDILQMGKKKKQKQSKKGK